MGVEGERCIGVEETLLVGGGYEAEFQEATGHRRETQHGKVVLVGAGIDTSGGAAHLSLHELGKLHTALAVLVGDKLKHDIALGRVLVYAFIHLLVVFLHQDYGVLSLGDIEVFHDALVAGAGSTAQRPGLEATCRAVAFDGVNME